MDINKAFVLSRMKSGGVKSEDLLNQDLAEELHKAVIRNIKKRKVHPFFIDNI